LVRYVNFDIEGLSAEYSHSREGHYELRLCTLAFISDAATECILEIEMKWVYTWLVGERAVASEVEKPMESSWYFI
jgi:hypothetical protein